MPSQSPPDTPIKPPLGIIAGAGPLPVMLVEQCRAEGRPCFMLGITGAADPALVTSMPHGWTRMGDAGAALKTLHRAGVRDLVLAGAVKRPSLAGLRLDWHGLRLYWRIVRRVMGDDSLLTAVTRELEREGFRVVGIRDLLPQALAPAGFYAAARPDARAELDIERGLSVLAALGPLDVGQAIVVQHGIVLGVEAVEGTDDLIRRCGPLRRKGSGGVLIKTRKRGQDDRLDLPTIGPDTVAGAAEAGLRGILVEAGGTIMIQPEEVRARADRLGLFVEARVVEAGRSAP